MAFRFVFSLAICTLILFGHAKADQSSSNQNAASFVNNFFAGWSQDNATALPFIKSVTADPIEFYGKSTSLQSYMKTQLAFANRWPKRDYVVQPNSLAVACNQKTAICNVSGIVNWTDDSPARQAHSAGTAQFKFIMLEKSSSGKNSFIIAAQSGAVISRSSGDEESSNSAPSNQQNLAIPNTAGAQELVAIKPGLICVSPAALAELTLPDGSSRTTRPNPSPADLALKQSGECTDITIGMRVSLVTARHNTSIVNYSPPGGQPNIFIVPNIDFQEAAAIAPGRPSQQSNDIANQGNIGPGGDQVAFVGCASDGQTGPEPAPNKPTHMPTVSAADAKKLAYYESADLGVMAPRGWYCFGLYGSNGSILIVTPEKHGEDLLTSDSGLKGPAVQLSVSLSETSGRFEAANIAAELFPNRKKFVDGVIAEGIEPASDFHFGPIPTDKINRYSDDAVGFETPANTTGLGTQSRLVANGDPIHGLAILTSDDNLTMLVVRVADDQHDLASAIIDSVRQEAPTSAESGNQDSGNAPSGVLPENESAQRGISQNETPVTDESIAQLQKKTINQLGAEQATANDVRKHTLVLASNFVDELESSGVSFLDMKQRFQSGNDLSLAGISAIAQSGAQFGAEVAYAGSNNEIIYGLIGDAVLLAFGPAGAHDVVVNMSLQPATSSQGCTVSLTLNLDSGPFDCSDYASGKDDRIIVEALKKAIFTDIQATNTP